MKTTTLAALVAALAFSLTPALAQKEKRPDVGNFPFWTVKKSPRAHPFVPGLNAVLMLTDTQKEKITDAREELLDTDAIQAASRLLKTNPDASGAQKDAARRRYAEAQEKLHERVNAVLTTEQRALIDKLNGAFEDTREAISADFQPRHADFKDNKQGLAELQVEMQRRMETDFLKRVEGLLTKEQFSALQKAAEEEKTRNAQAAIKKVKN
jgi:hypothetical protein